MFEYEAIRPRYETSPEVEKIVQAVSVCYQCGTCSGSCPVAPAGGMDYTPRTIMRLIQAGMEDQVLSSQTVWTCAACYSCAVRCPRGIDITDVMVRLRNLALIRGFPAETEVARKGRIYNVDFMRIVRRFGRIYELELVLRYHLKTNPFNLLGMAPVGLKMFLKHKLRLLPDPVDDRAEVKGMFYRLESDQARKGRKE
ncbi:MAG TPA: 4Fe-4S dicluster domain-containing protein [Anaerolineae bacterium]|nr:4Fe-4S dicluster domain-containing protein [Anaerolineae bacterium]